MQIFAMITELTFADGLGLIGSFIVVGAYYLATRNILPANRIAFNLWNLIGGTLVMISLVYRPNLGSIVIEVMFLLIAILAILRNLRGAA